MKQIESSGKTIEEALEAGLKELGCTIGDVTWTPLQEGAKGLFGLFGSRPAKVRITVNVDEEDEKSIGEDILSALSTGLSKPQESKPQESKPQEFKSVPKEKIKFETKPMAKAMKAQPPEAKTEPKPAWTPAPEPAQAMAAPVEMPKAEASEQPAVPATPPVLHPEDSNAGRAQRFLMQLTELMDVNVRIDVTEEEDKHLFVRMQGDTLGVLIGRRGETLDAIQYLTSLVVNRRQEEYVRVTLDTENYRAKREEALRRLAMRMANRAVKTGRRVVLEPMNPYERRILHASLQGHPQVTTHSEGEEPNRRIVITLKK